MRSSSLTLPERLEQFLGAHDVCFETMQHAPIQSAVHASKVRGTPLHEGAKAIVMKVKGHGFVVLAVRGTEVIDNQVFRRHLGVQRYRFATRDELAEQTGLTPGCVPPLGRPIFDMPLFVDAGLLDNAHIVFSDGTHTRSLRVPVAPWLAAAQPADVWRFATPRPSGD